MAVAGELDVDQDVVRADLAPLDGRPLDSLDAVPAYLSGRRSDILVRNRMAAALFGDWGRLPAQERNRARLVFLNPEYRELFVEWDQKAYDTVAYLRMDAGRHPGDPGCPPWSGSCP